MKNREAATTTSSSATAAYRAITMFFGATLLLGLVSSYDRSELSTARVASEAAAVAVPDEFRRTSSGSPSDKFARSFALRGSRVRRLLKAQATQLTESDDGEASGSRSSKTAASANDLSSAFVSHAKASDSNTTNNITTNDGSVETDRASDAATIAPAPAHLLSNQTNSNWSLLLPQIPVSPSRFRNVMPSGLRLAFVGDSITRYQAVSLMFYLFTGDWFSDDVSPSLVAKTDDDYDNWGEYFVSTGQRLGEDSGHHWCDCFRNEGIDDPHTVFENRYFREPERDNYVYLITKLGASPTRGRWWPSRIGDWKEPRNFNGTDGEAKWTYQWGDLIRRHLSRLEPRPTHVVFNEGLWQGISNSSYLEIQQALHEVNMTGIYRTTSKRSDEQTPDLPNYDLVGCSLFLCLDVSWTYVLVMKPYYCDAGTHFTSMVYTLFNQQLLQLLEDLRAANGERKQQ